MRYFVLVDENGNFIGVDDSAGGYPFYTDRLDLATIWAESFVDDMNRYAVRFPTRHMTPKEVVVKL